jgi:hypothetical protein
MARFERDTKKTYLIRLSPDMKAPLEEIGRRSDRTPASAARVLLADAIKRELHGRL